MSRARPRALRRRARALSLVEVMTSLAVAGLLSSTTVGVFALAVRDGGDSGAEWQAMSIAEQHMERFMALPRTSPTLADVNPDTALAGSLADRNCDSGVDGRLTTDMRVDDLGRPNSAGRFTLCWKVTRDAPVGELLNARVIVTFNTKSGRRAVFLQSLR